MDFVRVVAVMAASALLAACGESASEKAAKDAQRADIGMQVMARDFVKGVVADPGAAQFRNQGGACGEVNIKNQYGAYVGFQRFIAASKEIVVFERATEFSPAEFQQLWDKACAYRAR